VYQLFTDTLYRPKQPSLALRRITLTSRTVSFHPATRGLRSDRRRLFKFQQTFQLPPSELIHDVPQTESLSYTSVTFVAFFSFINMCHVMF
jgi:hypothetical protein